MVSHRPSIPPIQTIPAIPTTTTPNTFSIFIAPVAIGTPNPELGVLGCTASVFAALVESLTSGGALVPLASNVSVFAARVVDPCVPGGLPDEEAVAPGGANSVFAVRSVVKTDGVAGIWRG